MKIGVICFVCGVVCILVALALQFVFRSAILEWVVFRLFSDENNDEFGDEDDL